MSVEATIVPPGRTGDGVGPPGTPFHARPVATDVAPGEHDGTRVAVRTDAMGSLAMTDEMTPSARARARLRAGVLEALRESVTEGSHA